MEKETKQENKNKAEVKEQRTIGTFVIRSCSIQAMKDWADWCDEVGYGVKHNQAFSIAVSKLNDNARFEKQYSQVLDLMLSKIKQLETEIDKINVFLDTNNLEESNQVDKDIALAQKLKQNKEKQNQGGKDGK